MSETDLAAVNGRAAEASMSGAAPAGRLVAGRYRLRSLLGRGGMGRVFLAEDELLHREVALKHQIDPATGHSAAAPDLRTFDEARAAARIDHDGAVRILDVVGEGDAPWIVMEALRGRTLAELIEAKGRWPVRRVARLAHRLLEVVRAVHRAGVIHRDIKPANVYLCDSGRVVLIDFGIACPVDGQQIREPIGAFVGSPSYMAPELLRGGRPTPASDLFALGATLFATVEGRPPFERGDVQATVSAVIEDSPAPFAHAGQLRPVIAGLLAADARQRPTAVQALNDLAGLERQLPGAPARLGGAGSLAASPA